MNELPPKRRANPTWALWQRLAQDRPGFGGAVVCDAPWVTFTVTTRGDEFVDQMTALTGSEPGRGGLATLNDSGWDCRSRSSTSRRSSGSRQARRSGGATALHPERTGDLARKRMDECTAAEIQEEVLWQLRFVLQLYDLLLPPECRPKTVAFVARQYDPVETVNCRMYSDIPGTNSP